MEKHSSLLSLAHIQQDPDIAHRYHLQQELSASKFSRVYAATAKRNGALIALKIQSNLKSKSRRTLSHEYHMLAKLDGRLGVPQVYQFGEWSGGTFLQLEYLTERVEGRGYSLAQVTDMALQLLRIMEGLHAAKVLHQDLQPSSLMRSDKGQLYLVGFGRAKTIPIRRHPQELHPFAGNYRFASIRAHNQQELAKKDDLQSLFYVLAQLYYCKLPWSKISAEVDHKLAKIKQLKISSRDTLFSEMGTPFMRAFEHVVSLDVYGEPDYAYLKGFFKRRRTIVVESKREERPKVKKVSLNFSHLSPILEGVDKLSKNDEICQEGVSFTFGLIREAEGGNSADQNKQQVNDDSKTEDYSCQENFQPSICKQLRTLTLKNPFLS